MAGVGQKGFPCCDCSHVGRSAAQSFTLERLVAWLCEPDNGPDHRDWDGFDCQRGTETVRDGAFFTRVSANQCNLA